MHQKVENTLHPYMHTNFMYYIYVGKVFQQRRSIYGCFLKGIANNNQLTYYTIAFTELTLIVPIVFTKNKKLFTKYVMKKFFLNEILSNERFLGILLTSKISSLSAFVRNIYIFLHFSGSKWIITTLFLKFIFFLCAAISELRVRSNSCFLLSVFCFTFALEIKTVYLRNW